MVGILAFGVGTKLYISQNNMCTQNQGLYGFQKVLEIDNAILQDLESFGKREVFQNGYGKVLDFCLGKF